MVLNMETTKFQCSRSNAVKETRPTRMRTLESSIVFFLERASFLASSKSLAKRIYIRQSSFVANQTLSNDKKQTLAKPKCQFLSFCVCLASTDAGKRTDVFFLARRSRHDGTTTKRCTACWLPSWFAFVCVWYYYVRVLCVWCVVIGIIGRAILRDLKMARYLAR